MLTRCPACETTFRITPEQLKTRQGKVRCGECQHVFNALETLVEEAAVATVVVLPTPPEADAEMEIAVPPAPTFEPEPEPDPEPTPDPEPEPEPAPAPEPEPEPEPPVVPDIPAPVVPTPPPLEPLLHDALDPERPPRRWPWATGLGLALLALALQAVIHFRVELAVISPELRPALETLCGVAGCTVGLPSTVELMTIEASDLQPVPEQKGALTLTATLRNRAPFAQTYPHLELTLTDSHNVALSRRVLAAKDYLPAGTVRDNIARGLPSGELSIILNIDSGELGASGYRLYLFYP